ncbi:hypothetical protein DPMN_011485 [Dreissena polymorpha]|uniref:Uncharacterized protein n=1 Tax=Dreissena polymorpha TaxID=45954 RepID=A0A9D4N420_DREPO|nr:hypothetical protein DPMN_011485 [Dreissena polymorpha]
MNNKWPPGGHVFFNRTEPFLNSSKICPNFMKIMSSRLFTCFHYIHIKKTAPLPGAHVFPLITTIFKLVRDIHITNVLTKFYDDYAQNITSREFTNPPPPPPGGHFHDDWAKNVTSRIHVIQLTRTIFKLNSYIKQTNVLTKFHENWAKNVTSRMFTCFHFIHIEKNEPPTDINKTNVLTIFHDDWAKIVTTRVFTSHIIQLTGTIFELNSHIKETNVLTKVHENWAKNVTSRVEKCPAHWRPYINKTNVLTNFHDDWAKIVTSRRFTSHVIQLTGTIFELNSHIKETNALTKFHENWAKNVNSRVFTCFHYIHHKIAPPTGGHQNKENRPPTGGHVFQRIGTTFELN